MIDSNTNNLISNEWKGFLDTIEDFLLKKSSFISTNNLIYEGLKVFQYINSTKFVSLFVFNEDTAEFSSKLTIPPNFTNEGDKIFYNLSEQGTIGIAINKGSVVIANADIFNDLDSYTFVAPLIVSWGIYGILLITVDKLQMEVSFIFQKICSLYATILASSIENSILIEELKNSRLLLEQKVAERTMALAQSKREINAIFDTIHSGIMVIDVITSVIIKINSVCAQIINENEELIIGSKYTKYLDFETSKINEQDKDSKFPVKSESILKTSKGELISIIRSVSFFSLGNNRYRIENFNDIPEIQNTHKTLKDANDILELKIEENIEDYKILIYKLKQEISLREKSENEIHRLIQKELENNELFSHFITMVSHEFRTPLTIIRSSAQLINEYKNKLSDEEKTEYLTKIIRTIDNMTDLIDSLVFIGTHDVNQNIATPSWIQLKEFSSLLLEDIRKITSANREINLNFKGVKEDIFSDIKLLRLTIINLISNSLKYSNNKSTVDIEISCDDKRANFIIYDSGIVIPESEQERIFNVYYQSNNIGDISGVGIGMTVVIKTLKLLKGKIDINSSPGKGTIFTIKIPVNIQ